MMTAVNYKKHISQKTSGSISFSLFPRFNSHTDFIEKILNMAYLQSTCKYPRFIIPFVVLLVLAGLTHINVSFAREPLDKPNIIIFFVDDAGYGDFSHNGNPTIATTNISRLAHKGVNFTQFYTSSPACSASRYSLLTGRFPARSGLGKWVIGPKSPRYLHPDELTLAEGFQSQGYATAIFGKWHLGNANENNQMSSDSLPLAHGFEEWIGTNVSHDYNDAKLIKSDPQGNHPVSGYTELANHLPTNAEASEQLTGLYTDAAVRFVARNKDRPFFAYIAHNQPHLALFASAPFKGRSRRGLLGDVMEEIDDSVGRVLAAIKKAGIEENTIIIFSSDNGPWLRFKNTKAHKKYGEARMHIGNAYPFRDGKGSTWEGGYRVPGIFYWPGIIAGNQMVRSPVSTLDILPTLFKLVGVEIPADHSIDGRDIRPYLNAKRFQGEVKPFIHLYSYIDNRVSAIRQGPWKLSVEIGSQLGENYGFTASYSHPLLFQVEQDLGERIDRASEYPKVVTRMMKTLRSYENRIHESGNFWTKK